MKPANCKKKLQNIQNTRKTKKVIRTFLVKKTKILVLMFLFLKVWQLLKQASENNLYRRY